MNQVLFLILFTGSSYSDCSNNKDHAPSRYTQEESDRNDALWDTINRSFPILTTLEIGDCMRHCRAHPACDLIDECREFMFWKIANKENLNKKRTYDTCYKQYRKELILSNT